MDTSPVITSSAVEAAPKPAKASAMSRTTFALYFKTIAGVAPLTCLTEWRMQLALRGVIKWSIGPAKQIKSKMIR